MFINEFMNVREGFNNKCTTMYPTYTVVGQSVKPNKLV